MKAHLLTTARLNQAVASWVMVASSSCSCIFFSSFLSVRQNVMSWPYEEHFKESAHAFCTVCIASRYTADSRGVYNICVKLNYDTMYEQH